MILLKFITCKINDLTATVESLENCTHGLNLALTFKGYGNYELNRTLPRVTKRKDRVKFLKKTYWEDGTSSLANRCFCFRCEEGMTIKEMSMLAGVDESVIARIERNLNVKGKSRIRVEEFLDMYTWTLP